MLAIQTWSDIKADFGVNWLIYLSMPFVAAFVGWSTKIVALEMIYQPLDYKGIGPFGWQGIVPRRAGKVGAAEGVVQGNDRADRGLGRA